MISHAHEPPDIDPREHRLMIHGMVDRPLIFTMEEIRRLPSVSRVHFVECNADSAPAGPGGAARIAASATVEDTHGFTSCSLWTGVPLSLLLNQAGVKKGATWIIAEGAEESKHAKSIPLERRWPIAWSPTGRMARRFARNKDIHCGCWYRDGKESTM